jgi:hypothetical protein
MIEVAVVVSNDSDPAGPIRLVRKESGKKVLDLDYPGRKDGQIRARSSGHVASFVTGL